MYGFVYCAWLLSCFVVCQVMINRAHIEIGENIRNETIDGVEFDLPEETGNAGLLWLKRHAKGTFVFDYVSTQLAHEEHWHLDLETMEVGTT